MKKLLLVALIACLCIPAFGFAYRYHTIVVFNETDNQPYQGISGLISFQYTDVNLDDNALLGPMPINTTGTTTVSLFTHSTSPGWWAILDEIPDGFELAFGQPQSQWLNYPITEYWFNLVEE